MWKITNSICIWFATAGQVAFEMHSEGKTGTELCYRIETRSNWTHNFKIHQDISYINSIQAFMDKFKNRIKIHAERKIYIVDMNRHIGDQ